MKTRIITIHEEEYSNNGKTIGVLLNYSINHDTEDWVESLKAYSLNLNTKLYKESFIYIFHKNTYIFFNTIVDMNEYLLYGDNKVKRAYMEEEEFDELFDSEYINGMFSEFLVWL